MHIYIYICSPPPPKIHLERFQSIRLENSVHLCTTSQPVCLQTQLRERKTERERERRREFITRKKDRENKQIRTCVPVLLNGRMA